MAIIYSYPGIDEISTGDLILVSDSSKKNATRSASVDQLASYLNLDPAYSYYTALLTQTSTNAPVATLLSSNLTGTFTWARAGEGVYTLTASAATFTSGKTAVFLNCGSTRAVITTWTRTSDFVITIKTEISDDPGQGYDGGLTNASIDIRIYK